MQERKTRRPPVWPAPDSARGQQSARGAYGATSQRGGYGGYRGYSTQSRAHSHSGYGSYGSYSQPPARSPRQQRGTRRVAGVLGLAALVAVASIAALAGGQMPAFAATGPGLQITIGGVTIGASHHMTGAPATHQADGTAAIAETAAHQAQAKATPNQNCTLIVPSNPLSATGLATPYQLTATRPEDGPCHEANPTQSAFVQAAVIDTTTGQISIYDPLVVDANTRPATTPVVPTFTNGVVAIWFGFNGGVLQLRGTGDALRAGACVNGLPDSPFGQMAYCNAPAFFTAANSAIRAGQLKVPALGTGRDGKTCPTVRDFSVVDQDQSDNVTTTYLVTREGRLAQSTSANLQAHPNATVLSNGSDNGLLSHFIDGALGCQPWTAPNLADSTQTQTQTQMVTALPLDELQAAAYQATPVALVPSGDPMTLVDGKPNLLKQNLYRLGVDQPVVTSLASARQGERAYCQQLLALAPTRLVQDATYTASFASPMPTVANNLFTFLAQRLSTSVGPQQLNCTGLLGVRNPVSLVTNKAGVVIRATITIKTPATQATQATQATSNATSATSSDTTMPPNTTTAGTNAAAATAPPGGK